MPGQSIFNSCFSPFIKNLIAEKRNAGFQYDHAEWILHKFDEFCVQEQVEEPLITRGLAEKWGTLREAERKTTLAGRVTVLRQLSLYMQAYGIGCYVPGKISCGSSHVAYVLNSKEIRALFKEIDEYQPALNVEVFHRLALEYKILFRMSKFLGHSSTDDTFYYYHQVEEAFAIVREKDKSAGYMIPEVADEN